MIIGERSCIFHVDADSFFASVERARNPAYGGRPLCVIAGNGGCILAATYDAKKLGITTGMPYWQAIKLLPAAKAYYIPSHFRSYAEYSEKLFQILRSYSPQVEETSVDEGYLDMTGLRRMYRKSYEDIALMIQARIQKDLGLPVSIGIAPTKTLAKIASKKAKPFGVKRIRSMDLENFIKEINFVDVPGIGKNSEALLYKFHIKNPLDFVRLDPAGARKLLGTPGEALFHELRGSPRMYVAFHKDPPKSLSRIRSFKPTTDTDFLRTELIHHVLLCTYKLRRKSLVAHKFSFYFRNQHYAYSSKDYQEDIPHSSGFKFLHRALADFASLTSGIVARSVGVVFSDLSSSHTRQASLFEEENTIFRQEELLKAADTINAKFGKYTIVPASLDQNVYKRIPWSVELLSVPYLGVVH